MTTRQARAQQHGRREPAYNRASVLHARIHPYPFHARASSVVLCVRVAEAPPPAAFRGVAYWREYSTMRSVCARRCARRTYSKRSRARRGLCTAWCGAALSMAATKGVAQRTGTGTGAGAGTGPVPVRVWCAGNATECVETENRANCPLVGLRYNQPHTYTIKNTFLSRTSTKGIGGEERGVIQ